MASDENCLGKGEQRKVSKEGIFFARVKEKRGNVLFYRENDFFSVSLLLLGAKKAAVTFIIAQLVQNCGFFLKNCTFLFFTKVNCVKTYGYCFFCRNMLYFEGQTQLSQRLFRPFGCARGRKLIFDLRRSPFYPPGEEAGGKRGQAHTRFMLGYCSTSQP